MPPLYRESLPQLDGGLYLADGGIETSLIFHDGIPLPDFAAFDLFRRVGGEAALRRYFEAYAAIAARFGTGLVLAGPWTSRIHGLRANASRKSHDELNESAELDVGDPAELGRQYAGLRRGRLPELNVMGGCCGTDTRHVERIAAACAPLFGGSA